MQDDPVAELDAMLEAGEDDVLSWWQSEEFAPDSVGYAAARAECIHQHAELVRRVAEAWGKPDSTGRVTVRDGELVVPRLFPWSMCEFATEVAIWDCHGHVACVWWGALEDGNTFEVCIGVSAGEG